MTAYVALLLIALMLWSILCLLLDRHGRRAYALKGGVLVSFCSLLIVFGRVIV